MFLRFPDNEFQKLKDLLVTYEWGQRVLLTKLDIIHEDHKNFKHYNPIEHIKGRMKVPESIAFKLHRLGYEINVENARTQLTDIAGIRIICPFSKDIYYLVGILRELPECSVLLEKDYISRPKPSGYRSFHIILEVPVYYSGKTELIPVEIQIRTEAMNFWASLEHKARYKYNEAVPPHLCDELVVCAEKIAELDNRMFLIHEILSLINPDDLQ